MNKEIQHSGSEHKRLHSLHPFPCLSFPLARMWVLSGAVVSFVYLFSAFPAYIRVCWGIQSRELLVKRLERKRKVSPAR